jgi:TolA-binding protein
MSNNPKIRELPDFVKDVNTGAILNNNLSALEAYKVQRANILKMQSASDRINTLEQKVDSMHDMLSQILGKLK